MPDGRGESDAVVVLAPSKAPPFPPHQLLPSPYPSFPIATRIHARAHSQEIAERITAKLKGDLIARGQSTGDGIIDTIRRRFFA